MENTTPRPRSMKTFFVIWIGQLISMLGSGLTSFGLGVWIFARTGKATPFAITALFGSLPSVLLSPVAGMAADRYNRRKIMILADTGAAVVTLVAAVLLMTDSLLIWHIYLIAMSSSIFSAFQEPAYSSSITMLVPKEQLARAGGLMQMGQAISGLLTPLLAGVLFVYIDLRGIIWIDFITFFFAVGALLLVRIPQPKPTTETGEKTSFIQSALFGWKYLRARAGLFWILWYFAVGNFALNISSVMLTPLALTLGGAAELGGVQAAIGVGMLGGSIVMSAWGGPKRRVLGLIGSVFFIAIGFLVTGLTPSIFVVAAGGFIILFFLPFASALSQAIFQTKVAADVQGRVFAIRIMISRSIMPLAFIIAGPLADKVFEPLMAEGGALASSVGAVIGVGTGRGYGLMFIISFLLLFVASVLALAHPRIRNLETELPDAIIDEVVEAEPEIEKMEGEAVSETVVS